MDFTKFPSLSKFDEALHATRTAIEGSPAIKAEREVFLPNPSTVTYSAGTPQDNKQIKRYKKYLLNAEFEEYASQTQQMMIGKLDLSKASIDVPTQLEYLKKDADGDSLSFANGLLGNSTKNVLEAKWHIVLADYSGLPELDIDQVSIADAEKIRENARVKFKQYPRESLIKYNTSTINGVHQVDYMMFKECGFTFNKETGQRESVVSYLVLALDDDGNYYQEKHTDNNQGATSKAERNVIKVSDGGLKYIPFWVFSDEELSCGDFPSELGYISKIADVCLQRYRLSADFREVLSELLPTTYVGVSDSFTLDNFKAINGREVFAKGEANVIPGEVSVQTEGAGSSLDPFFQKFAETKQTLKSYGTFMPDEGNDETATKSRIDAAQQNAALIPIVDNLTEGATALMFYAGVFEGVWNQGDYDSAVDQIKIGINTEFDNTNLTGQEIMQLISAQSLAEQTGLTTKNMAIGKLYESGTYPSEMSVEDVLSALGRASEE